MYMDIPTEASEKMYVRWLGFGDHSDLGDLGDLLWSVTLNRMLEPGPKVLLVRSSGAWIPGVNAGIILKENIWVEDLRYPCAALN